MDSVYKKNSPRGDLALPEPDDRLLCSLSSPLDFCNFCSARHHCGRVRGRFNAMLSLTGLMVDGTSGLEGRGGSHLCLSGGDPCHAS